MTRHLDLGCGTTPRSPYASAKETGPIVFGVDVRALPGENFKRANLSLEPIPFADNWFGSVSAFDFFEHVPRVLPGPEGNSTRFPFVELMNEIFRVLAPGGRLWAVTPAFPSEHAFIDPTHVNIITRRTHEYFVGHEPMARMYGFQGMFVLKNAEWVVPADAQFAQPRTFRQALRLWHRRVTGRLTHFLWELEAVKTTETLSG